MLFSRRHEFCMLQLVEVLLQDQVKYQSFEEPEVVIFSPDEDGLYSVIVEYSLGVERYYSLRFSPFEVRLNSDIKGERISRELTGWDVKRNF